MASRQPARESADETGGGRGAFRLTRYFAFTSLVAFVAMGAALLFLERQENAYFTRVQGEQAQRFARLQEEAGRQQQTLLRAELLRVHEAGHVNLTRLFANVLWNGEFSPYAAGATRALVDACSGQSGDVLRECRAAARARLVATPSFRAVDARVAALMRGTTVFKIKVFDLGGMTVYSSEHAQVGEDKSDNQGWKSAVDGIPASELTHRDRFSAFEGVVENRDLISSYIPVRGGDGKVIGVFEIYSDVTPFLERIREAGAVTARGIAANQAMLEGEARSHREALERSSARLLAIIGGMMLLFYLGVLLLVRNGQRIIDREAQVREEAIGREARWHREKMTALATMSASIAHEIGNPLSAIAGNAQLIAAGGGFAAESRAMLAGTAQIAAMTRRMADFASLRADSPVPLDINHMVKAVCDFFAFDRRFRDKPIDFRPAAALQPIVAVPDHLNEALMSLLEAWAELDAERDSAPCRIVVSTAPRGDEVVVGIGCEDVQGTVPHRSMNFADARFESARRRVAGLGGGLVARGDTVEMHLPMRPA